MSCVLVARRCFYHNRWNEWEKHTGLHQQRQVRVDEARLTQIQSTDEQPLVVGHQHFACNATEDNDRH